MNMAWAKKWLDENFNKRNVEGLMALYSDALVFEDIPLEVKTDKNGLRGFFGTFLAPEAGDQKFLPESYSGDEKGGVVEWTWVGTMGDTDLFGLGRSVKGKKLRVRGNSVFRFDAKGLVIEERDYWCLATARKQVEG